MSISIDGGVVIKIDELILSKILETVYVSIIALVIGSSLLYWRYRYTLTFKLGTILIASGAFMGDVGMIVGRVDINFQTDPGLTVVLAGTVLVVLLIIAYMLYLVLFKPMNELAGVSKQLAHGVIQIDIPESNRNDEIGLLFNSYRDMLKFLNLQGLVERIKVISDQLSASSVLLAGSTMEVNASSEEIASIAQQLSLGAGRQTEQIDLVLQQVEDLQTQFEEKSKGFL